MEGHLKCAFMMSNKSAFCICPFWNAVNFSHEWLVIIQVMVVTAAERGVEVLH